LEELAQFAPEMLTACQQAMSASVEDLDFIRVDAEAFKQCPDDSIDYTVMEKTKDAVVVPMDAGWSDIGSWSSLWDISKKDEEGNVSYGDVILHQTSRSYVRTDEKLTVAIGVDDLVIISTKDAVVVAHKERVQDVKVIAGGLKREKRPEWEFHREVYRPWGKYEIIDSGERYQVKRITVQPGARLSVQLHHHRAEHWVVVSGKAKVINGEKTSILSENESTYIPVGVIHSLENPEVIPLEIIEIQSGAYLGEDDIVRFDDIYGRVER